MLIQIVSPYPFVAVKMSNHRNGTMTCFQNIIVILILILVLILVLLIIIIIIIIIMTQRGLNVSLSTDDPLQVRL